MKLKSNNPSAAIEATVLQLLAQREHTQYELCQKLKQRGYALEAVTPVLAKLAQEGWQSDARFMALYIQLRAGKGYGPLRITQELQQRGVAESLISSALAACEIDWHDYLRQIYLKKFKNHPPVDFKEKAKQIRFLQYRGFDLAQIHHIVA